MPERADIVVVGGGCSGTSIALQLARRRAGRILLIERDGIAAGATGRSSALIRQHYMHEALARMALRALGIFEHFADVIGGESGFRRTGFLVLVGPRDVDSLASNVAMHCQVGVDAHLLQPSDLGALDPRIEARDVGAAAWEPASGYADPVLTTNSYAEAARALGVEQRVGVGVTRLVGGDAGITGVETTAGAIETRTVVVAAGFRTAKLVAPLGVEIELRPIRHAIGIVQRSPASGPPHTVVSDRIKGSYYRPDGQELTLIGTTAPYEGQEDTAIEVDRSPATEELETLVSRFCARFPGQDQAVLRGGYTGVYDCSADLQPLLGPLAQVPGLHVAVGFSGHGFKLSPVVGELIAEKLLDGHTTLVDIALFSPNRFAEGRPINSQHSYSVATLG
ncbi:MAG: FAD-binding oxidoreductase [Chloroflexota bacterium]|nr:FAD-binding oxidoreductase [Chloroflexota bacterium]